MFDQRKLHLIFAAFIMSSMQRIVLLIKEELTKKNDDKPYVIASDNIIT